MNAPVVFGDVAPARGSARRATPLRLFLVELLVLTQLAAQAPTPPADSNAPEMSSRDAPATFSTKVNLVLVPVVVRDGEGRAVGTLQKEDFQLFDKGKPQIIARFSLEKAGAPPIAVDQAVDAAAPDKPSAAPPPPIAEHFVAYLFDDVHTDAGDLEWARRAAGRHFTESLDPSSRAGIFTTSGQVTLDFTSDKDKLRQTLARIQPRAGAVSQSSTCPVMDYYTADLIFNQHDPNALAAEAAQALASCVPPAQANTPQALQQAQQQAQQVAQLAAQQMINIGERETRLPLIVLQDLIRRLSAAPGSRTIVLMSPGFFIPFDLRPDETEVMDRAIRANVMISALDVRGLYTLIPGGDASQPSTSTVIPQYQQASALANSDVLAELAYGTGGAFFENSNDLKGGLARLAEPPEYRYVLGFSPQNLKFDGAFHNLKVALRNRKGLTLEARRGYYAPKHADDPAEDAKQQIEEALYSREEIQDIPVDLHMQFFKSSNVSAKLAVLVRVQLRSLRFHKADGRNDDNLTVLSGLFDLDGNYITGIEKVVEMRLRDQTLEKLLASGITVRTNFDVTPGNYVIRLVVRDAGGQTIAARNGAVQIP